jgi:hypothetical protein
VVEPAEICQLSSFLLLSYSCMAPLAIGAQYYPTLQVAGQFFGYTLVTFVILKVLRAYSNDHHDDINLTTVRQRSRGGRRRRGLRLLLLQTRKPWFVCFGARCDTLVFAIVVSALAQTLASLFFRLNPAVDRFLGHGGGGKDNRLGEAAAALGVMNLDATENGLGLQLPSSCHMPEVIVREEGLSESQLSVVMGPLVFPFPSPSSFKLDVRAPDSSGTISLERTTLSRVEVIVTAWSSNSSESTPARPPLDNAFASPTSDHTSLVVSIPSLDRSAYSSQSGVCTGFSIRVYIPSSLKELDISSNAMTRIMWPRTRPPASPLYGYPPPPVLDKLSVSLTNDNDNVDQSPTANIAVFGTLGLPALDTSIRLASGLATGSLPLLDSLFISHCPSTSYENDDVELYQKNNNNHLSIHTAIVGLESLSSLRSRRRAILVTDTPDSSACQGAYRVTYRNPSRRPIESVHTSSGDLFLDYERANFSGQVQYSAGSENGATVTGVTDSHVQGETEEGSSLLRTGTAGDVEGADSLVANARRGLMLAF